MGIFYSKFQWNFCIASESKFTWAAHSKFCRYISGQKHLVSMTETQCNLHVILFGKASASDHLHTWVKSILFSILNQGLLSTSQSVSKQHHQNANLHSISCCELCTLHASKHLLFPTKGWRCDLLTNCPACFSQRSLCASALPISSDCFHHLKIRNIYICGYFKLKESDFFRSQPPATPVALKTSIIDSHSPPHFVPLKVFTTAACCCLSEHSTDLGTVLKAPTPLRAHSFSAVLTRSTKASFQGFPTWIPPQEAIHSSGKKF